MSASPSLNVDVRDIRLRGNSPVAKKGQNLGSGRPLANLNPSQAEVARGLATGSRRLAKISGLALFGIIFLFAFLGWPGFVIEDDATHRGILAALFLTGITLVALEDVIRLDKAAIMLVLASVMWTYHAAQKHPTKSAAGHQLLHHELSKGLTDVGSVILFLLPAMGIVESIDHMDGFAAVTAFIVRRTQNHPDRLMPMICTLAFFLSSVIDNLTATIVCIKILKRVVPHNQDWRHSCGGVVVVAANAGGAWSPIGDVTTTMLWIQHRISTFGTVVWLFFPSLVAGFIPLFGIWWQVGSCRPEEGNAVSDSLSTQNRRPIVLLPWKGQAESGKMTLLVGALTEHDCDFPLFTGQRLPPYLGMMMALGVFWLVSEICDLGLVEGDEETGPLHGLKGVPAALHKVDLSSLLFFTGVPWMCRQYTLLRIRNTRLSQVFIATVDREGWH
ncbi:NHD2 [Symbiodinium natans]|uniref:NHD2 protein n=1 Tax=Symbiodinium natans TaxID=878477 RepID=A0A812NFZ1_9DINO|nr:NHD2 [Symbiodinium natans]